MDFELVFSITGVMAMFGWLTLVFSPLIPRWSDRIAGCNVPAALLEIVLALWLMVKGFETRKIIQSQG